MTWERDIYVDMLVTYIKEEKAQEEQMNRQYGE